MLNVKLGNKRLRADKIVQVYGMVDSGKTILASKILADNLIGVNYDVYSIDSRFINDTTLSYWQDLVPNILKQEHPYMLEIDGMDYFDHQIKQRDSLSRLIYYLTDSARDCKACKGISITSQHYIPGLVTPRDVVLQTTKYRKGKNNPDRYMAVMQIPLAEYSIIDVTLSEEEIRDSLKTVTIHVPLQYGGLYKEGL